ncbi:hypothetical protein FRACYDRAFT_258796 [Fragilariopsis cylindrus CCMP1102]|uniref:Uncharacterized protein n=1 Tax=Fragilariopsis cylindrus CCMP1102 TaxID=635003 RepID=A0A1E7FUC2_9STRA|nr:hypothetical protein FRACYDRAFT_258796 [Fragilariopsis cylindrus CCMP1102]|eukprot:OEU21761.1 hypothetical protein FRACYDRAFT_258796 [Fragilariopsis cylindrus CCMP1102]
MAGIMATRQDLPSGWTNDPSSRSVTGSSRPPLAGGSALSPHTVDGMAGFQTAAAGSRSRDASPPPNAGVISRPETQFNSFGGNGGGGNESFDSSLRRALSNESIGTSDYSSSSYSGSHHRQGSNDSSHLSSSFSQPSLNTNNSQHRVGGGGVGPVPSPSLQGQGQGLYHQSHQRSQSQPGPLRSLAGPENYYHEANYDAGFIPHRANVPPSSLENDYNLQQHQQQQQQQQHQQQDMRYNSHGGGHQQYQQAPRHGRSMSMQHSSYNGEGQDNMGYGGVSRRGSLGQQHDGQMQQHGGGYNARERVGNTNYHRQAPMHSSYGSGHNRHPGDTSNMSGGSDHGNATSLYGRHRLPHTDEDLSHPLAGENIEVPGEDHHYYNEVQGPLPPYQRSQSMGHGPTSYGSDSRHLPTVGSSIQTPKVVYNVKFKRTQRTFEVGPRLNRDLPVGTYIKVEADLLEAVLEAGWEKCPLQAGAGGGGDLKKIIRLATHDEVSLLRIQGLTFESSFGTYSAFTRLEFGCNNWIRARRQRVQLLLRGAGLIMDYGTPIIAPMSEYEGYEAQAHGAPDDGTGTD